MNSLTNKFDQVKEIFLKYVDILIITETKLDDTFPVKKSLVEGFSKPNYFDRNRKGMWFHDICSWRHS